MELKLGMLSKIISVVDQHKVVILSMMSLPRPEKKDVMIVLRLKAKDLDAIASDLRKMGLSVDLS